MENINAKYTNERTVAHLINQITNTDAHAGKLLAKTGDIEGYQDIAKFNERLRVALETFLDETYGE